MKRVLNTFKGRIPRLGAKNLPDGHAQTATNCDLRSGNLEPLKALLQGASLTVNTISRHLIDTEYYTSTADCDFVEHEISGTQALIVSDGTAYPKQYTDALYPSDHRRLGVVAPTDTLTITYTTIGAISSTEIGGTYSWCYTYVTSWGEESKPSPATAAVDVNLNQYVTLTNFTTPSAANKNDVEFINIYRLASGTKGAEYQYLDQIDHDDTTYADYETNVGLNTVSDDILATEDYDQPPATLAGIVRYANGMLAGFAGNSLYLSEPFIVYAWPDEYVIDFDSDIIAIAAYNDQIIVLTETQPYAVLGTGPESMMVVPINIDAKCVAKRGVVTTNQGVLFPSADGLILIDGRSATPVSKHLITKEQWSALTPADLIGFWYDDMAIFFFDGTDTGFFVIEDSWVDLDLGASGTVKGGYVSPVDNKLYLIMDRTTFYIETFNAHATNYLAYTWKSKVYNYSQPTSWSCLKILSETAAQILTVTVRGDGATQTTGTMTTQAMQRLAGATRYYDWDINIVSAAGTTKRVVESVSLATSPGELLYGDME